MILLVTLAFGLTALADEAAATPDTPFYMTFWSLFPPVVAIALALITKEAYSSLFIGILTGGLLYSTFRTTKRGSSVSLMPSWLTKSPLYLQSPVCGNSTCMRQAKKSPG